jgi:hypothetical protein
VATGLWLVAATALHLGFQLTVSGMVYPALADLQPDQWTLAHGRHSRRIVPLVVLTYALVLVALGAGFWVGPVTGWLVASAAGTALALATTAVGAAPLHGRLGAGHDTALVTRLLWVDRLRVIGAILAAVAAVGWALSR